jgi:hypothetical protein
MEADWEFEIGGEAPVIEAAWAGFVNLRDEPARIREIAETQKLSGLAHALTCLNAVESPVWTSKCDVFEPNHIDTDELSATREEGQFAIATYIDVLRHSGHIWSSPSHAERDCREICSRLRELPLRRCRVDIVMREARVPTVEIGATVYLTACGKSMRDAEDRLGECLEAFAAVIAPGARAVRSPWP